MTPTRPEPWYDPDPRDPRDGDMLDVSTIPPEQPEPDHRGRGCAWLGIIGALAVFWVGVALIVGRWLG
jgi:hypothetical protein